MPSVRLMYIKLWGGILMSEEASDKQELTETSSANEDCSECDDPCKSVFTKGLGILANAIIVNPIVERTYYPRVYTHKSLRPTSCTAPKQVLNINDIISGVIFPDMYGAYYTGDTLHSIRLGGMNFVGIARLHPKDQFNKREGRRIARRKAIEAIGNYVSDMENVTMVHIAVDLHDTIPENIHYLARKAIVSNSELDGRRSSAPIYIKFLPVGQSD